MIESPLDRVLQRLEKVSKNGSGWKALCPAHADREPSLTVHQAEDGKVLVCCHAGCEFTDIASALSMKETEFFVPKPGVQRVRSGQSWQFEIRDAQSTIVAIHARTDFSDGHKEMKWLRPGGKAGLNGHRTADLPLYGAHRLGEWTKAVVLVEGEKAAEALWAAGIPAVGTVTGADGTPSHESLSLLTGRTVVLWPDNDAIGRAHVDRIGAALVELGCDVRLFVWSEAPPKGDAADYLACHG